MLTLRRIIGPFTAPFFDKFVARFARSSSGKPSRTPISIDHLCSRLERDLTSNRDASILVVMVIEISRSDAIDAHLRNVSAEQVTHEMLERIAAVTQPSDYLALAGPDEIWLVLPKISSPAIGNLAATKITATLSAPLPSSMMPVTLRPVIGVGLSMVRGGTALDLLRAAREAARRARSLNQSYFVASAAEGVDLRDKDLVIAIENALAENRLLIAYQPKVDVRSGTINSVEALIRWPQDLKPSLRPDVIVDIAERFGMIRALTRHVLQTVLREYTTTLAAAGVQRIWVNLPAVMLGDAGLMDFLRQVIDIWGLPASLIGFEITEGTLITDIEQSIEMMQRMSTYGFALAIDDFGTGYSSLAYLRRFPIDELKIDKVFVMHMASSTADTQIVQAIIHLAHNFNLKVVAEGAEDHEVLQMLTEMGCDQVQGYVFAKPMPAAQLVEWMEMRSALSIPTA